MAGNTTKFENVKLWHNEYGEGNEIYHTYSVSVSSKKKDGDGYDNIYLPVFFRQGTPVIHNGSTVSMDGFLTCRTRKNGEKYIGMQVMNYEVLWGMSANDDSPVYDDADAVNDSFEQAEEDLPFESVSDETIPF